MSGQVNPVAEEQSRLLEQLREVRWAQEQLKQQEEALVIQAMAAGISGARVAHELGRARQVLHAQYSTKAVGWRDLDDAELAEHQAHARSHASGPKRQGLVQVDVPDDDDDVQRFTYDGRTGCWDIDPAGALPPELVARLVAAGDEAQQRAERRHAGGLKRQATIAAGNIRVGRPRRRR